HQGLRLLGVDDSRSEKEESRFDFPLGSVHASEHHVSPCQARFHAVVHLLYLEEHQEGTYRLPHGTHENRGERILPTQFLAEHSGHSSRVPATRRTPRIYGETRAGSNTRRQLRDIWSCI